VVLGFVITMTTLFLVVVCYKLQSVSQVAVGEDQLHELAGKVSQLQVQTDELERNGTLLSLQVGHIISRPSLDMQEYPDNISHPQLQTGQCCSLMCNVPLLFCCSDAISIPSFSGSWQFIH
jgi:hypothetical protein